MPDLSHNLQPSSQLPALTPDLVAEGGGEVWRVLRLAPHLARLAGVNPDAVRGRRLEHLFSGAVPALPELAREAAERDESLTGIRVCPRRVGSYACKSSIRFGSRGSHGRARRLICRLRWRRRCRHETHHDEQQQWQFVRLELIEQQQQQ
jgi:hypothetical protein